jgi:hypothetical protein
MQMHLKKSFDHIFLVIGMEYLERMKQLCHLYADLRSHFGNAKDNNDFVVVFEIATAVLLHKAAVITFSKLNHKHD